jgi:hypothetical protein
VTCLSRLLVGRERCTVEFLPAGTAQWGRVGFPSIAEPGGIAFDLLGRLIVANGFVGNAFIYDWTIPQLQAAFRCLNCAAIAMNVKGNRLWGITNSNQFVFEDFGYSAGNRVQSLTFPRISTPSEWPWRRPSCHRRLRGVTDSGREAPRARPLRSVRRRWMKASRLRA